LLEAYMKNFPFTLLLTAAVFVLAGGCSAGPTMNGEINTMPAMADAGSPPVSEEIETIPEPYVGGSPEQMPPSLQDLLGARAGEGEDALRQRGYIMRNSNESDDAFYTNWQEPGTGACVGVTTMEGGFDSISYVDKDLCR
jgi:hypothetical protein